MNEDVERTLRTDPTMAALVDRHGPLDVAPVEPGEEFRRLCTSILNQQLSTASARAIRERAYTVLDDAVTPERVLAADEDALGEAGVSATTVRYLRSAAEAFAERDLTVDGLADHTDDEAVAALTEITGRGTSGRRTSRSERPRAAYSSSSRHTEKASRQ
ncbi:hypothetical protein JCM17823_26690 [Halorubrum gandharaense]